MRYVNYSEANFACKIKASLKSVILDAVHEEHFSPSLKVKLFQLDKLAVKRRCHDSTVVIRPADCGDQIGDAYIYSLFLV